MRGREGALTGCERKGRKEERERRTDHLHGVNGMQEGREEIAICRVRKAGR